MKILCIGDIAKVLISVVNLIGISEYHNKIGIFIGNHTFGQRKTPTILKGHSKST